MLRSSVIRHAAASRTTSTVQLLSDLDLVLSRHSILDQTWLDRVRQAMTDLQHERTSNISIVGDRSAGVHRAVTAILDDPLANDDPQQVTSALASPPSSSREATRFSFGHQVETEPGRLTLPAKWLKTHNATITEIVHGDVPLESSFSTLHLSDAVLVLVSSTTLLSSRAAQTLLLNLHTKPNLIVCVNCTRDASPSASRTILDTLQHQLDTLFPSSTTPPLVMAVSTDQALEALKVLGSTTTSYEDFQRGYLASQLPKLKSILSEIVSSPSSSSSSTSTTSPTTTVVPSRLQEETGGYVLDTTLSRAAFSLATVRDTLESARSSLCALSQQATESSRKLLESQLGISPQSQSLEGGGGGMFPIPKSDLFETRRSIDQVFDTRLQFWKLPFNKLDDISSELSLAISQTYLDRFEKRLWIKTGIFALHQQQLSRNLSLLVSKPPFSSSSSILYSPVVENEISQTLLSSNLSLPPPPPPPQNNSSSSSSSSSTLNSSSSPLCDPISNRKRLLLSHPVSTLHRSTQKSFLNSLSISLASISTSISLDLFLGTISTENAVGFGVLGVTVGVWSFQRGWEKAKARFWRDFDRVNEGVSEDLGVVCQNLIERCEFGTKLAVRRYEEKIRERETELNDLRQELRRIASERETGKQEQQRR